jgi:transcriptional regulator with XRE-family HTH domain
MQSLTSVAVRREREIAGLSQQVLATKAGISLRTLSRIEAGEDCTVSTLEALAGALDLSPAALLAEPEPTEAAS